MGAPSPELCNLWLARAFNSQDVEAAAALYHPEASVVQIDDVHGDSHIAHGQQGIRRTMAAYIGLKPQMDVITHHTTVAGDFAMTRSQWLIHGTGPDGKPIEVHHHGMEVHRRLPDGTWAFFIDHPSGADPDWAVDRPPDTRWEPLGYGARSRHEPQQEPVTRCAQRSTRCWQPTQRGAAGCTSSRRAAIASPQSTHRP